MSDQQPGQPQHDPYAAQSAPYGQPGYPYPPAGPAYGHPGVQTGVQGGAQVGHSHGLPLAHWGKRVAGALLDGLVFLPLYIVGLVLVFAALGEPTTVSGTDPFTGAATTTTSYDDVNAGLILAAVGFFLGAIAFAIWNQWIRQGRTGRSLGKQWVGIRLVREATGQAPGIGLNIGRSFAHFLDSAAFYLGWLWPLWDAKRQTFADKICSTVVVDEPKA
ncbi:RDD family protein [Nocardioides sp. GCM10027113]|uniref:RDD family protein n=1 Tax=unclassified Nocardioides TaxID=2615069 RepID=UPI003612289E